MSRPPQICVVGSSNVDLIARVPRFPRPGETLEGRSFHIGYGGKGANQAVMAAKLGARVTMVTRVGRDVFGDGLLRNFTQHGIDTTHVHVDEERSSGVAPILVDDTAENEIVIVPGANYGLSPDDVGRAVAALQAADVVIGQLEVPIEATLEAFRAARAAGVRTILNPAPAAPLSDDLLALTDLCAPNEAEAEMLTGRPVATADAAAGAAGALRARGPRTVIITLGRRGGVLVDADGAHHVPAIPVEAVDATGAGDAFIGSLAVFLAEGHTAREAARRANAVAALSVTALGAQTSFPERAAADAFLAARGLT
ncbi:MAG TPA: ribokinase [bacterium]|nr:ribokinase [bacterium]